ncbi:MAG: cyclase family protein [Phycisphaerae bacterium]
MDDVATLAGVLSKRYRVVDLSQEVRPGILKMNGDYQWGSEVRRFELRQFAAPGPDLMHFVETETHVGTHVEVPSHIRDEWKSCAEMPLDAFWGEAIVLKFDDLEPGEDGQAVITAEHLRQVKAGDIVLLKGPSDGRPAPQVGEEAAELMASLPVRMMGEQNVGVSHQLHISLFEKDIPIIERLANLERLTRERFLFFGFPLRVRGLESSWIRAVAFEPIG